MLSFFFQLTRFSFFTFHSIFNALSHLFINAVHNAYFFFFSFSSTMLSSALMCLLLKANLPALSLFWWLLLITFFLEGASHPSDSISSSTSSFHYSIFSLTSVGLYSSSITLNCIARKTIFSHTLLPYFSHSAQCILILNWCCSCATWHSEKYCCLAPNFITIA